MSDYDRCTICNHYHWLTSHLANPKYDVVCEEWNGDDTTTMCGRSPEDAAENFVEKHDDSDWGAALEFDIKVKVRSQAVEPFGDTKPWTTYTVNGYLVPAYSAEEKLEDEE